MYMLMTYDVQAKRTNIFRKLLKRYLNHEQHSVFSGDITEAQAIRLRREISQVIIHDDRLTEITAKNRHNVDVMHLVKNDSEKGQVKRIPILDHKRDFTVL